MKKALEVRQDLEGENPPLVRKRDSTMTILADHHSSVQIEALLAGIRARQDSQLPPLLDSPVDIDGKPFGFKSTCTPSAFGREPFWLDSEAGTWRITSPMVDPSISVAAAKVFLLALAKAIALAELLNRAEY